MKNDDLTITEVARRTGLRPSAIRYYESIELLPEPRRVSMRRRYNEETVTRIEFIQTARQLGFSLTEIKTLLDEREASPVSDRWQTLARGKLIEISSLLDRTMKMKRLLEQGLKCRCSDLEGCIDCLLLNCQEG
ncbi:DNA-binding transcriptional MerR regulator [Thermosporothrix hazakensis]|jgi:MerR family redox-sensitive transcriptional activator SoxR|uniref:DNA-binding transcriptional MerR regulator n=2 Tax=Thermosporothrix TaxID=768650 RepID=A0A326UDQ9_THEHA|nr:MerR family transcriptional regulator [Thermosporothrix hazakensis]PZW27905.1 DNA-binding transcriptional MerR regulator [Thermosporothrix hazakensis]BBH86833.1 hypothetical protein KTC_15840 [Thermosporothrix sp. COM3]GCE51130.1 hypothetical protein KTH_59990 [Thermosporothrix hazakensis]